MGFPLEKLHVDIKPSELLEVLEQVEDHQKELEALPDWQYKNNYDELLVQALENSRSYKPELKLLAELVVGYFAIYLISYHARVEIPNTIIKLNEVGSCNENNALTSRHEGNYCSNYWLPLLQKNSINCIINYRWRSVRLCLLKYAKEYEFISQKEKFSHPYLCITVIFCIFVASSIGISSYISEQKPEMLQIPKGSFIMGCSEEMYCRKDERSRGKVTVSSFWISKTVITIDQYMLCVKDDECTLPNWHPDNRINPLLETSSDKFNALEYSKLNESLPEPLWNLGNYPAIGISWYQARKYTSWLSGETGDKYRLPTEAEWEYAARSGTTTSFPWGEGMKANKANCKENQCGDDIKTIAPAESFEPNKWGLFNMHGNVWEWVSDCGGNEKYCESSNNLRMLRGGAWDSQVISLSSFRRNPLSTKRRKIFYNVGFRVVK